MAAASAADTGNQAFLDAVAADNAELVHGVIKTDARAVSMEDEDNFTALMVAAGCGSLRAMQVLLDEGADPDDRDPAGRTALLVAAAENRPRAVTALAADEAFRAERLQSHTYAGNTALHRAAAYGGVPVLRAVIGLHVLSKRPSAAPAAINAVNDKGRTPLIRAARWGRVDETKELLRAGADASIADKEGLTAAAWAELKGHRGVAAAIAAGPMPSGDTEMVLAECSRFAQDMLVAVRAAIPDEDVEEDDGTMSPSGMQDIRVKGRTFSVVGGETGIGLGGPTRVEGWMAKKGHLIRNWRNRWFVLEDSIMQYYARPGDKKSKGTVTLTADTRVEAKPDYHRPCVFTVTTPKKSFLFQAADDDELDEWLHALEMHIRILE